MGVAVTFLLVPLLFARGARAETLKFAGRDWIVADGGCQADNRCAKENVWVDGEGLHLRLSTTASGGYSAASVESSDYTRCGIHRFYVRGPVADLHRNVVLGLFTFKNRPDLRDNNFIDADLIASGEGEIDIELTRWGSEKPSSANSYFTVQEGPPPAPAVNTSSVSFKLTDCLGLDCYTTHYFDWEPDRIRFQSFRGHSPEPSAGPGRLIHEWTYPEPGKSGEAVPREMLPKIIMNLYRADARDVSPGQEVEIIISGTDLPLERIPKLSSGAFSRSPGDPPRFSFSVRYDDPDGDAPNVKQVNIDGADHAMSLSAGSASDGVYSFGPVLSTSAAPSYYFLFADGHGGIARLPGEGGFTAPTNP